MFMIAGNNHGDAERGKTIVFTLKHKGYEIGIGAPYGDKPTVNFIWEYFFDADDGSFDHGTLYKYAFMTVEDVAELVLDRVGQGTQITDMVNVDEEAMLDRFYLALRDYVLEQVDTRMGLK